MTQQVIKYLNEEIQKRKTELAALEQSKAILMGTAANAPYDSKKARSGWSVLDTQLLESEWTTRDKEDSKTFDKRMAHVFGRTPKAIAKQRCNRGLVTCNRNRSKGK